MRICIFLSLVMAASCLVCCTCNSNRSQQGKKIVKIGAVIPLTGDVAKYGNWIREGMDLAVSELNSTDDSMQLEVIYEDDQCDAAKATNAMTKLATIDNTLFVVGSWCSSSVLAQAPIAEKDKVILLSEGLSPKISQAGPYTFRIIPTGRIYVDKIVEYLQQNKLSKIAAIYVNNDFGIGISEYLQGKLKSFSGSLVAAEAYESDAKDFKNQLLKVAAKLPEVVFIIGYEEAGQIIKQSTELNQHLKFLAMDTFENEDILKVAGPGAEGVIYPHFFYENDTASNPRLRDYQRVYMQKYKHVSEGFAAVSYDAVYLIADVLRKASGADRDVLRAAIANAQYNGVTGLNSFDGNGDARKNILLKIVRNGHFVKYE
jgi:branched-chain amino acid transport system substrate-binding protein